MINNLEKQLLDLGSGPDVAINIKDYNNFYALLPKKNVPIYLKNIKPNHLFVYNEGNIAVPDIIDRINDIVNLNNIVMDKLFIIKRARKILNNLTNTNKKEKKIKSIKNARMQQCKKYNLQNLETDDNYFHDDVDNEKINQVKDNNKNKHKTRFSLRIKKKQTKYDPSTGKAVFFSNGKYYL